MEPQQLAYEQWREILKNERLPAVVVDLDAFDRNIAKLASYLGGAKKNLRLATKSVRVPALIRRVLDSGAPYRGLMCFSAEELAFLAAEGFRDLLLAYPTVRASDLRALRMAHELGGGVTAVVDGPQHVEALAQAMRGVGEPFRVVIDIDVSLRLFGGLLHLGVRRSPVRTARDVRELAAFIRGKKELVLVGAMAYEAQIAGLGDRNPFKALINPFAKIIRGLSLKSVARARVDAAAALREIGVRADLFNGGGTGSINLVVNEKDLTELSAGSGLLCSHLFDYYSNVSFEPACFFALQAARSSDRGYVTCQGGGYIASGEPGWDRVPVPHLPRGLQLLSMEAVGEVQTPLRLPLASAGVQIGEPVLFRHAKAGELAERFNEYLLVSKDQIVERAKTYRGLGLCFY